MSDNSYEDSCWGGGFEALSFSVGAGISTRLATPVAVNIQQNVVDRNYILELDDAR